MHPNIPTSSQGPISDHTPSVFSVGMFFSLTRVWKGVLAMNFQISCFRTATWKCTPRCYLKTQRVQRNDSTKRLQSCCSRKRQELCSLWPSRAAKFVVVPTLKFRIVTLCHVSLDVFYPNLFNLPTLSKRRSPYCVTNILQIQTPQTAEIWIVVEIKIRGTT